MYPSGNIKSIPYRQQIQRQNSRVFLCLQLPRCLRRFYIGPEQPFQSLQLFGGTDAERMLCIDKLHNGIAHKASLPVQLIRTAGNAPEEFPYPFHGSWMDGKIGGQLVDGVVDESVHYLLE